MSGCYSLRKSSGAGQIHVHLPRKVNPSGIALPEGYLIRAEAVGFSFPTGVTFDEQGRVCVVGSGYAYGEIWKIPRLIRFETNGETTEIAVGNTNGPWTGVTFQEGAFYVAEGNVLQGGRILRIGADGKVTALVSNLPSYGDHHANGPIMGPDGLDFSRNAEFGHVGQAFVALFGDEAPAVGKVMHPVGAKIVRVDVRNGIVEDFAVNKGGKNGPASKVGGGGLERPVAVRFNQKGDVLYVADFGIMAHSAKGAMPQEGTGVLWKIWRSPEKRP
jgi:hypothetical protein